MKIVRLEDMTEPLQYGELPPEQLEEAYRLARESFTAADLQWYTEIHDDLVDAEEVLQKLEEQQKRLDAGSEKE